MPGASAWSTRPPARQACASSPRRSDPRTASTCAGSSRPRPASHPPSLPAATRSSWTSVSPASPRPRWPRRSTSHERRASGMTEGGTAMTVRGPVPADDLGLTLFHEHLHMDATPLLAVHGYAADAARPWDAEAAAEARWNPGSHPDNYRFTQDALVASELGRFRDAGGRTIVEQTPAALGRDPRALHRIATDSRVHVIMGTGQYLAATHEPWIASASEDAIADGVIREAREGVGHLGIRPGIIGEIGTSIPV